MGIFLAAGAEPHVVVVIDVDPVFEIGPFVPWSGTAPRRHESAFAVEFEHGRRGAPDRSGFVRLQRAGAMNDPNMVAGIDMNTDDRADEPSIGKWFGPGGINAIGGCLGSALRSPGHDRDSD